jgi:LPS sulfotransferase NodH
MINFKAIQFVGTQRSGSNLLRLILNQHKLISAPHPPHLLNTFHNLLPHYGNLENKVNRSLLVNDLCEWIANNPVEWTNINLDRDEIVDNCKNLIDIFEYVFIVKCKADNARIWCCKSTFNIEYTDQLEKGIKPFYIYLYRDGRDVAVSFKKAIVGPKHVYHIAKKWVHEQRQTRVFLDSVDSNRFIAISYEQMIHKPHMIINEICKKLEITYQDEMMNYFTSEESQHTAESGRMWSNVTKPIIRNNIANYKRQLTTGDIEIFSWKR